MRWGGLQTKNSGLFSLSVFPQSPADVPIRAVDCELGCGRVVGARRVRGYDVKWRGA